MRILISTLICVFSWQLSIAQFFSSDLEDARTAAKNQEYERAIKLFSGIIQENPKDAYLRYMRAQCYYEIHQVDKGIKDVKIALKVKPEVENYKRIKGNALYLYGRLLSQKNQKKKALKTYRQAAEFLDYSSVYSTIAFKEIQLGEYESALQNLNKAIGMDPQNDYAYSNRALLYVKLKKYEQAKADIEKAIALNSQNPYAFKHRALLHIALNDMAQACQDLEKAEALGYVKFGNESDKYEVEDLKKAYCHLRKPAD